VQDVGSLGLPERWFGLAVVVFDVFFNGRCQFTNAVEYASPNALLGDIPEEAFHHIRPGGAGWHIVHLKTLMPPDWPTPIAIQPMKIWLLPWTSLIDAYIL